MRQRLRAAVHPKATFIQGVNVLSSPELRDGIKTFSNWPTIPQLYVKGEFVGGCDIIREMHASGELAPLLQNALAIVGMDPRLPGEPDGLCR